MSDDPTPSGEKEYWHDKRLVASAPPAPAPDSEQPAVRPTSAEVLRMYRNLRHPLASFVVMVLLIILLPVGLLALTGGGALPVAPIRPPTARGRPLPSSERQDLGSCGQRLVLLRVLGD